MIFEVRVDSAPFAQNNKGDAFAEAAYDDRQSTLLIESFTEAKTSFDHEKP